MGSNPTPRTMVVFLLVWPVSVLISMSCVGVRGGEGWVFHRRRLVVGVVRLLVCLNGCGIVLSVGGLEGGCRVGGFPLSVHDVF